jgi:hypothetical protein
MTYLPHAILSQLTVTYLANTAASTHPFGLSGLRIASYGQLFGWLSQFAGHGFAEGRAPALLDNLLQGTLLVLLIYEDIDVPPQPSSWRLSSATWNPSSSCSTVRPSYADF